MRRRCSEYQPLIVTSFPRSGDVIRLLRGSLVSEITLQIATVEVVPCAGVPEPQIPTPMSSNFFICCIFFLQQCHLTGKLIRRVTSHILYCFLDCGGLGTIRDMLSKECHVWRQFLRYVPIPLQTPQLTNVCSKSAPESARISYEWRVCAHITQPHVPLSTPASKWRWCRH